MSADDQADRGFTAVARALHAMGALDVEAVIELLTDDVVLELPFRHDGGPRRLAGDDVRSFMRAMPKLFREMPFHDIVIHGALPSGQVVAEYRSEGVTRAGRAYPNQYVAFFTMRDGAIAEWREFFDPVVVAAAFEAR